MEIMRTVSGDTDFNKWRCLTVLKFNFLLMNHLDIIGNSLSYLVMKKMTLYTNYCLRDDIGGQHVCL